MKRRLAGAILAAAVISGAGIAGASSASAAPTTCGPGWAGVGSTYATATCTGGTGTFQVWMQCQSTVWPYGYSFNESAWYKPGATAWVYCPFSQVRVTWGIGRRN